MLKSRVTASDRCTVSLGQRSSVVCVWGKNLIIHTFSNNTGLQLSLFRLTFFVIISCFSSLISPLLLCSLVSSLRSVFTLQPMSKDVQKSPRCPNVQSVHGSEKKSGCPGLVGCWPGTVKLPSLQDGAES